jgi:myo-inositol-hexaphosphate 3-phosphohydrolase
MLVLLAYSHVPIADMNSEPTDSVRYFQNLYIRSPYLTESTVFQKRTQGEISSFKIINLRAARITAALLKSLVEGLLNSFYFATE